MSTIPDSAFYYFNKVTSNSTDSSQIAYAYINMAFIQADAGDYFGSQESLLSGLNHIDETKEKDQPFALSIYNELGTSTLKLKEYDAALEYLDLAMLYDKDHQDEATIINNKALAWHKKHNYAKAISYYREAEILSRQNKPEYARVISNLANARWMQNPAYNAAPELWQAMQIRKNEKDEWGLNASYSHLSDFYSKSKPDSALYYAEKMYAVAKEIQSPPDELEALEKLIRLGPASASQQYFHRYQFLNDSIQTARSNARNQFALIRYETEKSKSDNLILQKDNTEKRIQIVILITSFAGILLLLGAVFSWYRKRKQQILKEQELKTSQKVHDIVANGLYSIMTMLQHNKNFSKEDLLDQIDLLYEQSRDISYEHMGHQQNIQKKISRMLTSFATTDTRVVVAGNSTELWKKLSPQIQSDLELILKNLMINMTKHSNARNVSVRFESQPNQVSIRYQDDGIGIGEQFKMGNGLKSTENRINNFGGGITFEKNEPTGLRILINIPIY